MGRVTALDAFDLTVAPGEVVALTGESGSGKSTALSVAAGLIVPDSGQVTIASHPLVGLDDPARSKLRREHIGIIFQQANLISSLRVGEQLVVMDHLRGQRLRPQRAKELLDFVGLGGLADRRMNQLSGGQRQRVNIARALMADPEVLLADEPTSALDSQLSAEIMDLLICVTKELNTATVVVTHSEAVASQADRKVSMQDGKVLR